MTKPLLFEPLTLRSVTIRNRIGVSPMCQYSCVDGVVGDWHLVHLGSRAIGGAGLVIAEATGISPEGRISPSDTGIWNGKQVDHWRPIVRFLSEHGAVPAIQLAHAGMKASTAPPWLGGKAVPANEGGWQPIGVTDRPFTEGYPTPRAMTVADIDLVCKQFGEAVQRAIDAGFRVIEIHAAHGYLFHSFLSPLTNTRTDNYGGSFENRTRFLLRVVKEARAILPQDLPLLVRLSCSDWVEGGWSIGDSVQLSILLKAMGVDLIDCSSGGAAPHAKIALGPGYQTAFSAQIRRESQMVTACVGMISSPHQAETILRSGQADMVFLARELLRDPYWPARAAKTLGTETNSLVPIQYQRAW